MKLSVKYARSFFLLFSVFFCFSASYIFLESLPLYKSYFSDEDIFYGNITSVSASRFFAGTEIPVLDKNYFCLNEDKNAVFILILPQSQKVVLGNWFKSWAQKGFLAPLEVRGKRISKSEWLVTYIEGNDGAMDSSSIRDFHLRISIWSVVTSLFCLWIVLRLFFKSLRRR